MNYLHICNNKAIESRFGFFLSFFDLYYIKMVSFLMFRDDLSSENVYDIFLLFYMERLYRTFFFLSLSLSRSFILFQLLFSSIDFNFLFSSSSRVRLIRFKAVNV
jgi:hypothetical protein